MARLMAAPVRSVWEIVLPARRGSTAPNATCFRKSVSLCSCPVLAMSILCPHRLSMTLPLLGFSLFVLLGFLLGLAA